MKILIFNTFYFPKFIGGAEISVQLLAEKLAENGHEVFVATIGQIDQKEKINGVTVIRLKQRNLYSQYYNKKRNALVKILWHIIDSFNPFYKDIIAEILNDVQPDIVHTNNIQGFSPLIWKIIKKRGVPIVHTLRDYYLLCHKCNMFNNGKNCESLCRACSLTNQLKNKFISYPDVYVGVSQFILKKHQSCLKFLPDQSFEIIYNGVEAPPINNKSTQFPKITFGFIGRISEEKGAGYLVDQVLELKKPFANQFSLVFAGKGDDEYVEYLKAKLDGIDYEFIGVVKPNEFYEKIDILIVPSKWNEPFGRVVVEALACSIPVCLTESGGLKELHREECTWLFKPGEQELSPLLANILISKETILVKQAKAKDYAKSFTVDKNAAKYLHLYGEVNN
ncbi:MAG TPA: glycosyltransferase family 4 protein [Pseudosphingobacterium sp.]|nr:glycosyltransferase family 4 protein [Pseudosphingobacterium sp.]